MLTMSFTFLACLVSLWSAVYSAPSQTRNLLDLKATSCNINIQTGPNKKLEDMILGVRRQLDEIQQKLRGLTMKEENNTKGE